MSRLNLNNNNFISKFQKFIVYFNHTDHKQIVETLLKNGADVHAKNVDGKTALDYVTEGIFHMSFI